MAKKTDRPSQDQFPELPDLKDRALMKHAKTYADEMFQAEEALERAATAKQAIRNRMGALEASHFVGHGYEFTRATGEEKFSARKVKRGSQPDDTDEGDGE